MKEIKIATRGSRLALAQANSIRMRLASLAPDTNISIVTMSTKGDRDKSDFLYKSESVGFFSSEIEAALLDKRADIAVHSLKDLPTALTPGLMIAAIPEREDVCDVIAAAKSISSIDELPKNAIVGTSSLRRITQLKLLRRDLDCRPLRGNVETRLRQVREGIFDAIVAARAGLNRLGMSDRISLVLSPEEFVPAPGQGALAVQTRQDNIETCRLAAQLDDPNARVTAETERHILCGLHGGCSIPLGVHCRLEEKTMHIHLVLCDISATRQIRKHVACPVHDALKTADRLTQEVLNEGGRDILDEIRRQSRT